MLRRKRLLICIALVTVSLAGVALGKAVKQELVNEDGEVMGKAKLNYAKGADKTEIQINCRGLQPETDYFVWLCQCDGDDVDCIELGSFTTNKKGRAKLHTRLDGDASDWCVVVGYFVGASFQLQMYDKESSPTIESVVDHLQHIVVIC